jgi:hypothetical protein
MDESQTLGDQSLFALSYGYGSAWSVGLNKNAMNQVCRLDGPLSAHFSADGWVLGNRVALMSGTNTVTVGRGTGADAYRQVGLGSTLSLLGQDEYSPQPAPGATQLDTSFEKTLASLRYSQTIWLAFIPVNFGAELDLRAGIQGSLGATPPTVECDRNVNPFDMHGSVRPYFRADASAWVGVDLLFADAGIMGKLNLVTIGVPVAGGVHLQGTGSTANLVMDASANLDIQALSGGIYGYVDVFGARVVEEPIFTWDGLHYQKPLYSLSTTLPVVTLDRVN